MMKTMIEYVLNQGPGAADRFCGCRRIKHEGEDDNMKFNIPLMS